MSPVGSNENTPLMIVVVVITHYHVNTYIHAEKHSERDEEDFEGRRRRYDYHH